MLLRCCLLAVPALIILALACVGDDGGMPTGVSTPTSVADNSPTPTNASVGSPTPVSDINGDGIVTLQEQGAIGQGAVDDRSLTEPARNTIFSCSSNKMEEPLGQPWVGDDGTVFFADKPIVDGLVEWDSETAVTVSDEERDVSGNGLPAHPTGDYPADMSSEAWQFDPNPNTISAGDVSYTLSANPTIADEPTCLPMGPIGVALSGALFFNALDADNRDAVANEVFDVCEGHPAPGGQYHYHHGSPCFDQDAADEHSPLVGYALDGFAIYGPRDAGGVLITNDDLDECHGHTGPIPTGNSGTIEVYHYHINEQFPYTLGCFRGVADLPAGP